MPYIALTNEILSGDIAKGYKIYFRPKPADDVLPTVWADLHVWGGGYHLCDEGDLIRRFNKKDDKSGRPFVKIPPLTAYRFYTEETIGVDNETTAVVSNVASKAKHGLIIAPGKIDPGFKPTRFALVIFNQSNKSIKIQEGDKIASVAFVNSSGECKPTQSTGHFDPNFPDYEIGPLKNVWQWAKSRDYAKFVETLIVAAATAYLVYRIKG